jgi:hypothetical protein
VSKAADIEEGTNRPLPLAEGTFQHIELEHPKNLSRTFTKSLISYRLVT